MRKKASVLVLMLVVVFSLLIPGCKDKAETQDEAGQADETAQNQTQPEGTNETEEITEEPEQEEEPEPEGFGEGEYSLAYTLADLETFIQQMDYLIGADAPSSDVIIVTEIKTLYISRGIDTGDAKLTNEVDDYKDDFIIIGSPCDNPAAASLFAKEIKEKGSCRIFPAGEALIKLKAVTNNDIILYVGGNTPAETKIAAEVIKYPGQYGLTGTEVRVRGTVDEPVISVVG